MAQSTLSSDTMADDTDSIIGEQRPSGGDPGFRDEWLEELCGDGTFDSSHFDILEKVIGNLALHECYCLMVPKHEKRNEIIRSVTLPGFSGTGSPSFKRVLSIAQYAKAQKFRSDDQALTEDINLYNAMLKQKADGTCKGSESDVEDVQSERPRDESRSRNGGKLRARSSTAQGHDRESGPRKRSRLPDQGFAI